MGRAAPWAGSIGLLLGLALAAPGQESAAPRPGETRRVGADWFRFLGHDARGRALWLYPRLDGVAEVFAAGAPGSAWEGELGSRFDPGRGAFTSRFDPLEALERLRAASSGSGARREAARHLALFLAIHPAPEGPAYLRDARRSIARQLDDERLAQVEAHLAARRSALAGLDAPGTAVLQPPAALIGSEDHYRALVADGYLDIVVVGGNSRDEETGRVLSGGLVAALGRELEGLGLRPAAGEGAAGLLEGTAVLCGLPVRVRALLVAGADRPDELRRALAAFVEGLAAADVFVYLGHSNHDTGTYYVGETKSAASRLRIGRGRGEDLAERCHSVGARAHQLVALQSCTSYPKYCQPLDAFCAGRAGEGARSPGLIGTTAPAYFEEFVPRYRALLAGLLRGEGPRQLARALDEARPRPDAAPMLLRGVLQPRHAFVVPPGVAIVAIESDDGGAYLEWGRGSDGRRYPSTGVFPQDRPGDVVQVVPVEGALVALGRDGRLLRVGPDSGGALQVDPFGPAVRARTLAALVARGRSHLALVDPVGRVHVLRGEQLEALEPDDAGPRFVAVGNDARGQVVALTAEGAGHAWRPGRGWEPLPDPVSLSDPWPSLFDPAGGALWLGGPEGGALAVDRPRRPPGP